MKILETSLVFSERFKKPCLSEMYAGYDNKKRQAEMKILEWDENTDEQYKR